MNSQINTKRKFRIHTLGCKVNQYESQAMREILIRSGMEESGSDGAADVYIVNTCTVTGEADRESKNIMNQFHRANPSARIVATGCLAERDADKLSDIEGVSDILKNSDKNRIADILGEKVPGSSAGYGDLTVSDFKGHSRAYIKIQDGCENRCSYCKVPLVRGQLKSKSIKDIESEVARLVSNGFREIVLTGICLGAWGREYRLGTVSRFFGFTGPGLIDVLEAIEGLSGDFRVRLSSIEPKYVTDELIGFMARSKRVCAHLHIPFQSGDDDILRLMNRPYTAAEYKSIVDKARAKMPDMAVTTDILLGFPGETHHRFRNTMSFIRAIAPSRTHIFSFSGREGTPAYDMVDKVDQVVMKKRYVSMSAMTSEVSGAYKREFLGRQLNVLVETTRDKATGLLKGYSENYIHILFAGADELMRNIVPVKVVGFDSDKVMGVYDR